MGMSKLLNLVTKLNRHTVRSSVYLESETRKLVQLAKYLIARWEGIKRKAGHTQKNIRQKLKSS